MILPNRFPFDFEVRVFFNMQHSPVSFSVLNNLVEEIEAMLNKPIVFKEEYLIAKGIPYKEKILRVSCYMYDSYPILDLEPYELHVVVDSMSSSVGQFYSGRGLDSYKMFFDLVFERSHPISGNTYVRRRGSISMSSLQEKLCYDNLENGEEETY
jgi:hypothetical protein